jgi:hypothetical protein
VCATERSAAHRAAGIPDQNAVARRSAPTRTSRPPAAGTAARSRPRPLLLELPGGCVVLAEVGVITAHHLRRDRDYDTVVATVEAHPAAPGRVVPQNAGPRPWVTLPDGEGANRVEPGRRLATRSMTIDFGPARGRIPGSQTAGALGGGAPAGEGGR